MWGWAEGVFPAWNLSRLHGAVATALGALIRESARELRDLELARLDDLLLGLWADARKGNVAKIGRVLVDLLGLDAPTRFADVTDARRDVEEIAAEIGKGDDQAVIGRIERDLLLNQEARR